MKKTGILFICIAILLGFTSCIALDTSSTPYTGNASAQGTYRGSVPFIFVERGVEFAIYPNGEFDFAYVGQNYAHNPYNSSRRSFSFNAGYNYDMYLQFDRFGAVIQIENVPVYYDYYGRIVRAGNVELRYIGDYVSQIGNMHIMYERGNVYLASSGYINSYNMNFRPQPWHSYYTTPYYPVFYNKPYRENYRPIRYDYTEHVQKYENRGRSNYDNGRRSFIDPVTQAPRRGESINRDKDNSQNSTNLPNRGRENTTNSREPELRPGRGESTNNTGREQSTNEARPGRGESTNNAGREQSTNEARPGRGESTNNTGRRETTTPTKPNTREVNPTPTRRDKTPAVKNNTRTNEATPAQTNRGRSSTPIEQTNNRGR